MNARLLAACAAALAIIALLVTPATAHDAHPGLDFAIGIDTDGDGADNCSTAGGDDACMFLPGHTYSVKVYLLTIPEDLTGYNGFDVFIGYAGLTSTTGGTSQPWPDCVFEARNEQPGLVATGCIVAIAAEPSTYAGHIVSAGFACPAEGSGSVSLLHGWGATDLLDSVTYDVHTERDGGEETLQIVCDASAPVPPVPPDLPAPTLVASTFNAEDRGPVAGWAMTLHEGPGCAGAPLAAGVTDANGSVRFRPPSYGMYSVLAAPRPGWTDVNSPCQSIEVAGRNAVLVFDNVPAHNGDVNSDLRANSIDSTLVLQDTAGYEFEMADAPQGDVDYDFRLTSIDSALILQYDAGLLGTLPVR